MRLCSHVCTVAPSRNRTQRPALSGNNRPIAKLTIILRNPTRLKRKDVCGFVRFSAPIVPNCFETCAQVLADACSDLRSMIPFAHAGLEGIMARRRIG